MNKSNNDITSPEKDSSPSLMLSYASPDDPWLKRFLINAIESLSGRPLLEKLYVEILNEGLLPEQLWAASLDKLHLTLDYDNAKLMALADRREPLVFVANHPYGVIDGLIFGHLISQIRPDFVLPVNDLLSRVQELRDYMLPINFDETREALRSNVKTRNEIMRRINSGATLGIFPAGGVATAHTLFGPAIELDWKRFTAKVIDLTRATVVPVFFHGQNSRWFHWASRISMTLRLAFLLHEVRNKIGDTIRVAIGEPVEYSVLQALPGRQERLDYLRKKTLELGKAEG